MDKRRRARRRGREAEKARYQGRRPKKKLVFRRKHENPQVGQRASKPTEIPADNIIVERTEADQFNVQRASLILTCYPASGRDYTAVVTGHPSVARREALSIVKGVFPATRGPKVAPRLDLKSLLVEHDALDQQKRQQSGWGRLAVVEELARRHEVHPRTIQRWLNRARQNQEFCRH